MLVYLDNCCFNRPIDNQLQVRVLHETEAKLAIQTEIRDGNLKLAWSYILDFENEANPNEQRKESIQRWRELAVADTTETDAILKNAKNFHDADLKKKDSLHLASAIALKCDMFLTTDDGILKKRRTIHGVKILNPIEYYADCHD